MSKKLRRGPIVITEKMKAQALSRMALYWKDDKKDPNWDALYRWSIDYERDRRNNNPYPAIERMAKYYTQKFIGKFTTIEFYLTGQGEDKPIRKYDEYGKQMF